MSSKNIPQDAFMIALVGNPNTGKTTIFNGLCRSKQKTGNYPGTTIEKKIGLCNLAHQKIRVLDLPGLYSLQTSSLDGEITKKGILGKLNGIEAPDLLLFVADATNLRRNLFLFTQISEIGLPILVVLNMQDQMEASGVHLDISQFERRLGVPVVPLVGHKTEDIETLKKTINDFIEKEKYQTPYIFSSKNEEEERIFTKLYQEINKKNEEIKLSRFELREYLLSFSHEEVDENHIFFSQNGWSPQSKKQTIIEAIKEYKKLLEKNPAIPILSRYSWIDSILKRVLKKKNKLPLLKSHKWDKILTHRFWGLFLFATIMYIIFQSIYSWAEPAVNGIEISLEYLTQKIDFLLTDLPLLQSFVQDGVISGIGAVLVFLPQIIILFFFIAVLEDSGYLVRAAFLMDRLFSWSGLNGRSFIPLLSSFACAIPGILSTRVMPERNVRLATILIAPLMSCSARLPIYLLFIGAFIEPLYGPGLATLCLFFMHSLGPLTALPIAWLINRGLSKKAKKSSFIMEFPPYRRPNPLNIFLRVHGAAKKFTVKAGTIILFFSIIIWGLSYFPQVSQPKANVIRTQSHSVTNKQKQTRQLEHSYLGKMGKAIAPVFSPLGFDWKITMEYSQPFLLVSF